MDQYQDTSAQALQLAVNELTAPAASRKRVGFTSESPVARPPPTESPNDTGSGGYSTPLQRPDVSQDDLREVRESLRIALAEEYPHVVEAGVNTPPNIQRPRPAIRKLPRTPPESRIDGPMTDVESGLERSPSAGAQAKERSGIEAHRRAARLSRAIGTYSAPVSHHNSQEDLSLVDSRRPGGSRAQDNEHPAFLDDDDDEDDPLFMERATELLRQHTMYPHYARDGADSDGFYHTEMPLKSGQTTPRNAVEVEAEYVARPTHYRTGILGTLLKANAKQTTGPAMNWQSQHTNHVRAGSTGSLSGASTAANTPSTSPPVSGSSTPRGSRTWFSRHHRSSSTHSISQLVGSSAHSLATPGRTDLGGQFDEQYRKTRPNLGKRSKSDDSVLSFKKPPKRRNSEIKIKIHIAATLARQNYLRKLCRGLMMYGAPTHRLEEYLNMSARVLEIEAQFLYMPGCMIIAFDDSSVHASEVKLVRAAQGVDFGKLRDVHEIYKDVVHDRIGVEEAITRLDAIINRTDKFSRWLRVFAYGLATLTVSPFAFQARFIDLPFCFLLGCIIGWLQLSVAPGNELISNVFEIGASVITSFAARALGSIRGSDGHEIFCFSAMAQSSIALILPGFMVLCASLELQSKHIVAGSVRMVYAIIYSLFLGFGITIGTVLYGMMDKTATSRTTCRNPMSSNFYYLFVPAFSICLMVVNQAKYKQMPSMTVIAFIGWVVNFHSSKYFTNNAQVSNTLGALAIGIAANVHARFGRHAENWCLDTWEKSLRPRVIKLRSSYQRRTTKLHPSQSKMKRSGYAPAHNSSQPHSSASSVSDFVPYTRKIGYGLAAAAMLPAIFVQVPSGLSVQGSLVAGLTSADQIVRNTTANATTITAADVGGSSEINSIALNVGFSVIQIAIGITVGLFLAALIVYPLGKRRSGLFSF